MNISQIQALIEIVRSETQKGGNTKERIANLLTEINNAKMQRDGSNLTSDDIASLQEILDIGGSDVTLEQARINGNTIEGNILGSAEFNKSGNRKAFAQMSDVYDNSATLPVGTQRQVLGYSSTGVPQAVTMGWKQLSDMPSPPTFSNGVLVGTAFQPDGTALFAFAKLAIDSAESGAIPFYQTGGKLLVQNGSAGLEAVNFTQLSNRYQISSTNITAPDSTWLYAIITDTNGNTRRLNLATYLNTNFLRLSGAEQTVTSPLVFNNASIKFTSTPSTGAVSVLGKASDDRIVQVATVAISITYTGSSELTQQNLIDNYPGYMFVDAPNLAVPGYYKKSGLTWLKFNGSIVS